MLRRGMRLGRDVHVLYDGSEAAGRGLELAIELLGGEGMELTVILAAAPGEGERLEREVREMLGERGLDANLVHFPRHAAGPDPLAHELRRRDAGLLVVARESLGYDRRELGRLFARLPCPLLVAGTGGRAGGAGR